MKEPLFQVGYNKNGELDFGITATVGGLNRKEMDELRSMTMVAIGISEDMWRRNHQVHGYTDKDFN